jgi:putative transposase
VLAISVPWMKQVVKVRLLPTEQQAASLEATLRVCNEAASWLSAEMHAGRVRRKYDAQRQFYRDLRQRWGLSAQPAIRVIAKVADAYSALRANINAGNYGPPGSPRRNSVWDKPISFRADASQPFDARCLSWKIPDAVGAREATVSVWTTWGRLKGVRVLAAQRDLALLRTNPIRETDLIRRDGKWFLYATVEFPDAPLNQPVNGFVGVDVGIVNIATSSDGHRAAGAGLNRYRKRQQRLRARLQAKKTSSARRLLKRRRRKEARRCDFVGHADHNAAINIAARGVERWGEVMRPRSAHPGSQLGRQQQA